MPSCLMVCSHFPQAYNSPLSPGVQAPVCRHIFYVFVGQGKFHILRLRRLDSPLGVQVSIFQFPNTQICNDEWIVTSPFIFSDHEYGV